jgi:pimeloyl-ACP methyl ester carboxylesterase
MTVQLPSIGSDFTALYGARVPVDRYAGLGMPALVIRGGRSPQPTRRIAERLAATIPQASLIEIADGGHMLPLTHAGRLAACIRAELMRERA